MAQRALALAILASLSASAFLVAPGGVGGAPVLRAGAAAVEVTPHGPNPAWGGWIDPRTGLWGEEFTDLNGNHYWDPGEPFVDDPVNTLLDPLSSAGRYDGPFIGG